MHKALARTFRPQHFSDVLSQDVVVTTLLNAIRLERISHAYLFSGTRGSGKTTLARLFARALNCTNRQKNGEACNTCPSCTAMMQGSSMDLIEIDGASSRGIDDIRKITETIAYSPSSGRFTIYLIDEVHMLTKEAFNALLKTLEEPPPQAKFLFATTEPHKIPDTIKSRCQHFALRPISPGNIVKKLEKICLSLKAAVESTVLSLIAERADGSLRDAETLLDQLLSTSSNSLTLKEAAAFFAVAPNDIFDELDEAFSSGNKAAAFLLVKKLQEDGVDLSYFFDQLIGHFRKTVQNILLGQKSAYDLMTASSILDYLLSRDLKSASHISIRLESALLFILSSKSRLTLTQLVEKLESLEKRLLTNPEAPPKTFKPHIQETLVMHEKAPVVTAKAKPLETSPAQSKAPPAPVVMDKNRTETVLQFAAVELEGTLKRKGT